MGTITSYSFAEFLSDLGGFVFAVYLTSLALVLLYTQIMAQHELFSEIYSMQKDVPASERMLSCSKSNRLAQS